MKQLFGFIMLVAVALGLLAVVKGIDGIFSSISSTWTVDQTAQVATGLSEVLWLGGIITVVVLGYGLFVNMSKSGKGWSSRSQQESNGYEVLDNPQVKSPALLAGKETIDDWHDWSELERRLSE